MGLKAALLDSVTINEVETARPAFVRRFWGDGRIEACGFKACALVQWQFLFHGHHVDGNHV
jgi:hypothetical protein